MDAISIENYINQCIFSWIQVKLARQLLFRNRNSKAYLRPCQASIKGHKESSNYIFKVNNRNARIRCENMFKVNNKDTRTTPYVKIKTNLNFYFHTSLWCVKRFYEGLNKTFWGTAKKCENKRLVNCYFNIGVVLVSLLVTLNIFHTLFYCFYC